MPGLELWTIALLVDISIKTALLAILAWVGLAAWRVRGAHLKHRVWLLVLTGMLLMPALVHVAPGISLPYWLYPSLPMASSATEPTAMTVDRSVGEAPVHENQIEAAPSEPVPVAAVATAEDVSLAAPEIRAEETFQPAPSFSRVRDAQTVPSEPTSPVLTPAVVPRNEPAMTVVAAYLLGVTALMLRLLIGLALTAGLVRRARQVATPLTGTGLPAWARVAESAEVRVPVTIGCWRPVILLPADWTSWDESSLAMVLAHEGEHVRRRDTWVALLATLNCAVYWFHPVAWLLRRRLTDLAEQICDDEVIRITGNRSAYAQSLLDIAGRLSRGTGRLQPVGVAMARKANVAKRIEAIIDRDRPLSRRIGTLGAVLLLGVVVPLIFLAAGLRAADSAPPPIPEADATQPAIPSQNDLATTERPEPSGKGIAGLVVMASDGTPVADAEVSLRCGKPDGTYLKTITSRTNEQGRFAFANLPEGKYRVLAFHQDLASRSKRLKEGEVHLGDTSIRLELRKAPSLSVKVMTRAEGKPIAGANIHFPWTDSQPDYVCNENGEILIHGLTPEPWQIEVTAKGYAKEQLAVNLSGADTTPVTAELDLGAELFGTVRDQSGRGLAGVGLNVYSSSSPGSRLDYVETDAEGEYRFESLPIDTLSLYVSQDGNVTFEPKVAITVPPGEQQRFDITLRKRPYGGAVRGTVVDSTGVPISGATVRNHGRSSRDIRTTTTAKDGTFLLEDVFRSMTGYHLVVKAKGFTPQLVPFAPGTREKPAVVKALLPPGHFIRGKVVDENGAPIAGVWIDAADAGSAGGMNLGDMLESDEQGRFQLDTLPPDAPFDFSKSGYSDIRDMRLPLDGDKEVVVTLLSEGVILGHVVDARTSRPISPFKVQITFSPDRRPDDPSYRLSGEIIEDGEQFGQADGSFRIGDLVRGAPLQVTVEAEGYDRMVMRRIVATGDKEAMPVEFRLAPVDKSELISINGRVVNEQSRPMSGVQLRLIVASKRPFPRDRYPFNWEMIRLRQIESSDLVLQFLAATTDAQGRFQFRNVRAGNDIELAYWGSGVSEDRVEHLERLSPEQRADLTVRCRIPGTVRGAILPREFSEISRVALSGSRGFYYASISPDKDSYEFQDVPEGRYELQVYGPYRRSDATPEAVGSDVLRRISVDVKSGETVTVDLANESDVDRQPLIPGERVEAAKSSESPSTPEPKKSSDSETESASVPRPAASQDGSDIIVAGKAVDEQRNGISGARLWLPLKFDDDAQLAEATTTETGEFTLRVPAVWTRPGPYAPSSTVWCHAPGYQVAAASASSQLWRRSNSSIQFVLKPRTDTGFDVKAPDGTPVRGARVEPFHFYDGGLFNILPKELRDLAAEESDQNGRVLIPEMGRDRLYTVQVTADGYGTQSLRLQNSAEEPSVRTIQLRPTGRLEGRLVCDNKAAIQSARIYVYQEDFEGQFTSGTATATVDENGQFIVPAFAEGAIELIIQVDQSLPLRPRIPRKLEVFAGETTRVEVPLEKTVRVRGRVQTKKNIAPVAGALVSVQYGSFRQGEQARTDADGRFEANVLSGSVRRQLIMRPEEYSDWIVENADWQKRIEVPLGSETFDLPPLELAEPAAR